MNTSTVNRRTLRNRSLRFHWRASIAVILGSAAGSAALIGALFVGDSMRVSLRETALARLGPVDYALEGGRFFRASLAEDIAADSEIKKSDMAICPLIVLKASVTNAEGDARVNDTQVLGVEDRFWRMFGSNGDSELEGRSVILNQPLADALRVKVGDDVLLRLPKPGEAPLETLLGRRDDTVASLRVTVREIIPPKGVGSFALQPKQLAARNAYLPLATLQRALNQADGVNTLLAEIKSESSQPSDAVPALSACLARRVTLADVNLKFQSHAEAQFASLESSSLLIEPPAEAAALKAARSLNLNVVPVLTYLANSISAVERPDAPVIPYSTVTALDPSLIPAGRFVLADGSPIPALSDSDILLNEWAADQLGMKSGGSIALKYFVSLPGGRLEERTTEFKLRGVVRMAGWAGDSSLTPTYEGITNAKRLSDWDPPFPFDMKRIRQIDEDYWDDHQALPKAFISQAAGQRYWNADHRFGSFTSIRIIIPESTSANVITQKFEKELLANRQPAQMGLAFRPVRDEALAAGDGSTDFGQLFIGFSSFLIIAAAMLVALMFRLGVERRAGEVGLLLAIGMGSRFVRKLLSSEGTLLVVIGTVIGLGLAGGYAWLMLAGLRSWWSAAVNAPFLRLAVKPASIAIGLVASMTIARLAIIWAFRAMSRNSAHSLLAGQTTSGGRIASPRKRTALKAISVITFLLAVATALSGAAQDGSGQAESFFASGSAMLISLMCLTWLWLVARPTSGDPKSIRLSTSLLAARNARRQPARSLLATGLIASATFVIVAVGASRKSPRDEANTKTGGTGGYSLIAETTAPIPYNLNTRDGRSSLGLRQDTSALCDAATISMFRLRPGDDSSCLNLYKINRPRILGATADFVGRAGFSFSSSIAESKEEKENPWLLLNRKFPDGAVPAIGDESAVRWLLHLGLGDDMPVTDDRGEPVNLRIVAMLSGSVLQGELIIAEDRFRDAFPSIGGYSSFLIDTVHSDQLTMDLERDLSRFGFDAEPAADRLAQFMAVENTYMSTFQSLGGLGLLLGVVGLAAVMMRNIWERRGELALLRALGLRTTQIFHMSFLELTGLLMTGLLVGTCSALLAVGPHAFARPEVIPWASLAAIILLVLLTGLAVGAICIRSALKTPLLAALRRE